MSFASNVDSFFANLEKLVNAKTVFGESITIGDTTIIPVVDITFGIGTGTGADRQQDQPGAAGGGAGARLSATAIIVIRGDYVQVVQIKKSTYIENLVDMLPELLGKLKAGEKPTVKTSTEQNG